MSSAKWRPSFLGLNVLKVIHIDNKPNTLMYEACSIHWTIIEKSPLNGTSFLLNIRYSAPSVLSKMLGNKSNT